MNWLLFTLAAIACRATYGVFSKTLSRSVDASPAFHSALLLSVCVPVVVIVAPFIGELSFDGVNKESTPLVVLVLASSLGNWFYFKSMQRLSAGVAQIAFSSILVWGAGLSVLVLDSRFSYVQLAGGGLLMAAIWLAQYEKGERINAGVLYMFASAACFAGFQVASADITHDITTGTYALIAYAGPAIITFGVLFSPIRREFRALRGRRLKAIASTLPASVTSVGYYAFAFFAYRKAPDAGVVVLLLTSQVIFGVLLAVVFLDERRHLKRTFFAGALALLAGIAIKV